MHYLSLVNCLHAHHDLSEDQTRFLLFEVATALFDIVTQIATVTKLHAQVESVRSFGEFLEGNYVC